MEVLLAILASHHTKLVDNTYILKNVAQIVSIGVDSTATLDGLFTKS